MHEVSIMRSTLDVAEDQARRSGATHIHSLRMRIGLLSGVVADALRFAFEALRQNTLAASALLEIEEVRPACWCMDCQAEFEVNDYIYECPRCRRPSADLRRGREIALVSLEIS
ncbi:MAG: hydrogenase maturation nickel metallochaperone HypA [Verrucomicrobia bacterium]|jgi:hydrogenase nickel incorporation protein HypA/HybF|nr:hydrogenase maturation nickel metallochaperone HypA [Verrucomicrobiota bacterium]